MTKGIVQDKAILWIGSNQIKRQEAPLKLKANHGTKGKSGAVSYTHLTLPTIVGV